jgi:NADH-quinone oxidoreductase subunit G
MPKLTIDGIEIEVEQGTSIIQAAEQLGIEIPRFCYHDKLSVPANCRMCLVEVSPGPPKPQASCALACADGMEVKTNSDVVKKARKGVMEMLLINHPLDCPICDQGGECDLQDQAVAYGFDRSRYHESKRAKTDPDIGPLINTVMTRCIQCTRCVRFGDEVAGKSDLGFLHRGENAEITTFIEKGVETELSGNMIDICPVGALTSKPYEFKARPWELTKTETIDVHDAVGSNIRVDSRGGEVLRVLPRLNEDINEEWISDKTRFAYDGLKKNRLDKPYVRDAETGKLRAASWEEAFSVVSEKLKAVKRDRLAGLVGDLCDVESMVAFKDFMKSLGTNNLECRIDGAFYDVSERAGYLFNSTIAGIDEADAILLVGTNPRHEATMINARIRKSWVTNKTPIAVIGEEYDLSYPYEYLGSGTGDLEKLIKAKSGFPKVLKDAKRPMIIVGSAALQGEAGDSVQGLARSAADKFGMVGKDWNGFNVLHHAASRVGALDIGFVSKDGFDLSQMDVVYLMGADDFDMNNISKKAFVIYQGHHGDLGAHRADVILPGAAYTEKNGTYVNTEGRVQRARRAVFPVGEAREDWKIFRALSAYFDDTLPYDTDAQLAQRMITEWPHLGEVGEIAVSKWADFGASAKIKDKPFENTLNLDNYYLSNSIARASTTMMKCVEAFAGKQNSNEKKVA